MKFLLAITALLASAPTFAQGSACSYHLDGQAYIGKDDGVLKYDGKIFRCETLLIGESERNFCKVMGSRSKNFELVVAFDGAENDFFVFKGLDADDALCHGVASERRK